MLSFLYSLSVPVFEVYGYRMDEIEIKPSSMWQLNNETGKANVSDQQQHGHMSFVGQD